MGYIPALCLILWRKQPLNQYAISMMASFDYNYQDPSLYLYLMPIKEKLLFKPHWEYKIE